MTELISEVLIMPEHRKQAIYYVAPCSNGLTENEDMDLCILMSRNILIC